MRKLPFSFLFLPLTLISLAGWSQTTTPTVTNAGGGSYNDPSSYVRYFEWSIGELALIHTATAADNSVSIYQGVLQPCSDKPGNPVSENFEAGDFTIAPNPTSGKFEINFFIRASGTLDLEMTDMLGRTMERRSFRYYGCCRIEQYDISNVPAGVYFVVATLTPDPFSSFNIRQVVRHSGLKIIKIR